MLKRLRRNKYGRVGGRYDIFIAYISTICPRNAANMPGTLNSQPIQICFLQKRVCLFNGVHFELCHVKLKSSSEKSGLKINHINKMHVGT